MIMVQNVSIPRDDIRGDECWSRNEKSFVTAAHDANTVATAGPHSCVPNLNRYHARNQSMPSFQPHLDPSEQLTTAIKTALLNFGTDVTEFVLIFSGSDGNPNPTVLSSPGLRNYTTRIANEQVCLNFTRSLLHSRSEIGLPNPDDSRSISHFDAESGGHQSPWDQKLTSPTEYRIADSKAEDSDEDRSPRSRKRARVRRLPQSLTEDQPLSSVISQKLIIGNDADVDQFYHNRFKDMQQSSCKVMGKAFVKLVEPRKQTHHPYTGGNDKAPSWWPETEGPNAVRHKEPDHLLKPERINLLVHIIKMIVEPSERQNPTIKKLGLNVKKLEETTMEVMSNWFNDKEHPENLQKKKFLKEIFRVARMQERYKRGEIDGPTPISVMCGVENREHNVSDDEEDSNNFIPEPEIEVSDVPHPVGIAGVHTPESIISPPLLQHTENELRLPSQSLRQNLQRNPISLSTYDSHLYRLDASPFQTTHPRVPNIQDSNRRSFAQSGYNGPQSPLTLPWSTTPMINSSGQNSIFFPQPSSNFTYLPPQQQQQQQQVPSTHGFESLHIGNISTNRGFDTGHTFGCQQSQRTGNLSPPLTHPSQTHAHAPYNYGQGTSNIYTQDNEIKHEQQQQHRQS